MDTGAGTDAVVASVGPNFQARFAGTCPHCGLHFAVGWIIAYVNPAYSSPVCRECAVKARRALEKAAVARRPDACAALTKSGGRCRNRGGPDGLCATHREALPANVVSLAARRRRKAV